MSVYGKLKVVTSQFLFGVIRPPCLKSLCSTIGFSAEMHGCCELWCDWMFVSRSLPNMAVQSGTSEMIDDFWRLLTSFDLRFSPYEVEAI